MLQNNEVLQVLQHLRGRDGGGWPDGETGHHQLFVEGAVCAVVHPLFLRHVDEKQRFPDVLSETCGIPIAIKIDFLH